MKPATLTLFERPTLTLDGGPVVFTAERRFQVLALLAVRDEWVHRDEMAALFWPEQTDAAARSNVRKVLFRIRESLPDVEPEIRGAELRWLIESDVRQLLRASSAQHWDEVVKLYRGPLLSGLDDPGCAGLATWLERERQRFLGHARQALLALLEQAQAANDHARTRDLAALLMKHDPLDEPAVAAWCEAQVALGQREQAERRYNDFTRHIAEELGLEPSDRLRALARVWRATPAAAVAQGPGAALDRFIGRRQEASELQALLTRGESRLLTIVGPGGVGKSRLLREALPQLSRELEQPARWLTLSDLKELDEMPARLAALLGLGLVPAGSTAEQLIALLGPAPQLLALDNAEHLNGLGPLLLNVLAGLPGLRIVLTSRERLSVSGEWVLPLGGMPVPDAESQDPEAALAFDSVRLFVERARQVHGSVESTDIEAVVDIVQRVDGLPLAIELAAAWTRLLSPREIAIELQDSIALLAAADGSTSVEAVIDRSWSLLAPREREVLAALAVFAGGFTATMARRVCDAPLPVQAALGDKSLLSSEPAGRLAMHPLVHHVMRAHAERTAWWATLKRRHCECFASWLEELLLQIRVSRKQAAQRIDEEHANCRAALQFAATARITRLVRPIAHVLSLGLIGQTRFREGVALFTQTLALVGDDSGCRAPLLQALAALHYRQGDLDRAEKSARQGLLSARRAHDRDTLYRCLHTLALVRYTGGDHAQALRLFQWGAARLRASGDAVAQRAFLNGHGMALKGLGRLHEAAAVYSEALVLAHAVEDIGGVIALHNNIGNLHRSREDFGLALKTFDEGLAIARLHGGSWDRTYLLVNRGLTLFELDELTASAQVLEEVLDQCRLEPQAQMRVAALKGLARIDIRRGSFEQAESRLALAGRVAIDNALSQDFATTMLCVAELNIARGQRTEAAVRLLWAAERHLDHAEQRLLNNLLASLALATSERSACAGRAAACSEVQLLAELNASPSVAALEKIMTQVGVR